MPEHQKVYWPLVGDSAASDELAKGFFSKKNRIMKNEIEFITPQFERTWKLDFDFIPKTNEEFIEVVTQAPVDILKGMGFCYWDTINTIVEENYQKPKHNVISIPALNMDGSIAEDFKIDIGRKDAPTAQHKVDQAIYLIPGEWYDVIPEGFILTSISGSKEPFKKGETDNDIRFGCLAYGITRTI